MATKIRSSVPSEVQRLVKVEAGHRCSMPNCGATSALEIHHIDDNTGNNDQSNLLLLCAVCHSHVTKGELDQKACLRIKEIIAQTASLQTADKSDLETLKSDVIAQITELVGSQDNAQAFVEDAELVDEPSIEADARARQVIILARAGITLPAGIIRSLAGRLYEYGDYDQALNLVSLITATTDASAIDFINKGILLSELDKDAAAEQSLVIAIKLAPDYAIAWNNLGITLSKLGREDEAEKALRTATELDPKYTLAWINLGTSLSKLGREVEAETAQRTAIELDPANDRAWHNLGLSLDAQGRYDESEIAYRKAVEINPDDAQALHGLGSLLDTLGKYEEAEKAYRQSIALDDTQAIYHNNFAYFLLGIDRMSEAETEVQIALDMEPKNPYANATLGLILFEKNALDKGCRKYERAIKLAPDDLDLQQKFCYEYGRALIRNGYNASAREQLNYAKSIESGFVPTEMIDAELAKLVG